MVLVISFVALGGLDEAAPGGGARAAVAEAPVRGRRGLRRRRRPRPRRRDPRLFFRPATTPAENFGTKAIYIGFCIGVPCASLRARRRLSPVQPVAGGRPGGRQPARRRGGAARLPREAGPLARVAGIFGFAAVELCWAGGQEPDKVGVLAIIYVAAQFVGMGLMRVEAWMRNGDAFGRLLRPVRGAVAAPTRPCRPPRAAPPLTRLVHMPRPPATVALVCTAIG